MRSNCPLLSVLIPVYRNFELLERCLKSLRNQDFADFEVWVVDDGSELAPTPLLQDWREHWARLHWLRHVENRGRAAARNTALWAARGQWLVFLDADMAVAPDFLSQHWRFHLEHGPTWIGQGKIIETRTLEAQPQASIWTDASRAYFATGNVSVSRTALLEQQGFDESFSEYGWEDLELGLRLKKAGCQAAQVEGAISWHYQPGDQSWEQAVQKEWARGRGAAQFLAKHSDWEVRLMTQLTPLHQGLDWLFRGGGLITETRWRRCIEALRPKHPALAEALYRALLSHYCLESAHAAWRQR